MQELFFSYFQNSLSLSVVVLLTVALSPLLSRRYSGKCRYYLWAVVFFALLLPMRPKMNIVFPEVIRPFLPLNNTLGNAALPSDANIPTSEVIPLPSAVNTWDWMQYATWLWAAGAITFIAWHIFQHVRFSPSIKRWSVGIQEEDILELFAHAKRELDVQAPVTIKICACIKTPMLVGLRHPMVLLPQSDFNHEELALILRHELIHYKRNDLWFKVLMMLALAIHWFNPVIYLAVKSALTLCEISCDEIVLKGMNARGRAKYGESIIGVVRNGNDRHTAFSTNFYSGTNGMKKRIYAMMDMTTKRFSPVLFLAVLIVTFLGTTTLAFTPAHANDLPNSEVQGIEVQPAPSSSIPVTDESTVVKPEINVSNLPANEVETGNDKIYPDANLNYIFVPQVLNNDHWEKSLSNLVGLYGYDENGGVLITPEIAESMRTQIINAN
jgi:beta-lactamase regulating signal transducer with metallopeptidase domain